MKGAMDSYHNPHTVVPEIIYCNGYVHQLGQQSSAPQLPNVSHIFGLEATEYIHHVFSSVPLQSTGLQGWLPVIVSQRCTQVQWLA